MSRFKPWMLGVLAAVLLVWVVPIGPAWGQGANFCMQGVGRKCTIGTLIVTTITGNPTFTGDVTVRSLTTTAGSGQTNANLGAGGRLVGGSSYMACDNTGCARVGSTHADLGNGSFSGTFNFGAGTSASTWCSGSASIDFANALVTTYADSSAITVACATTTGTTLELGVPNAAQVAGSIFQAWVNASGQVTVRHVCAGAAACDPGSGTFYVRAIVN